MTNLEDRFGDRPIPWAFTDRESRGLAFAVTEIDAVVAKLKSAGITFLSPVQTWEKTGKRLVYLHGPDGILLELAEYPDERQR